MNTVTVFRLLGTSTIAALAASFGILLVLVIPAGRRWVRRTVVDRESTLVGLAWGVSLAAMSGSLYLSEIVGFIPCELCWFQRIAMFPLVFVLGVGALRRESEVWRYAILLPIIGLGISIYHVALQYNPALDIVSCSSDVPCTARYLMLYGFISIPTMAGAAFLLIALLLTCVWLFGDE